MKIDISTKNITLDDPLKVFIEEKIGSLEKFMQKGPVSIRVEIGKPSRRHRTGPVFYAEANLKIGGILLRSEANNKDLRAAVIEVKDELQAKIRKFKEKKKDLSRKPKK